MLPELWPFWHGMPWLAIAMIFCALFAWLGLPALASLAIRIYLGIKGNEIAIQHRLFRDEADFRAVEKAWAVGGLITLVIPLGIAAFIIFVTMLGASVSNSFSSVNNQP